MPLSDLTMLIFTACNSLRFFAYIPQLVSIARDDTGCAAISYATWGMFLIAHASAVAYALVNVNDSHMAVIFAGNAACCLAILILAGLKRWRFTALRRHRQVGFATHVTRPDLQAIVSVPPVR